MSSANTVPETTGLTGHRALDTIRAAKVRLLVKDSVSRLRFADGFSHSRAMAFQLVLALIPGTIVLVALASELRWGSLSDSIIHSVESLAPGPTADVFRQAFGQGTEAGSKQSAWSALSVGGLALVVAGTTCFGQLERAANRIYGVEADRPPVQKYGLAAVMTFTAGTLSALYFFVIGMARRGSGKDRGGPTCGWSVAGRSVCACWRGPSRSCSRCALDASSRRWRGWRSVD